jgi:Ca2+-binding EF-hand superfamily protein
MLSLVLATLTLAPAGTPLACAALPRAAVLEVQGRGKKPMQGKGKKPTTKRKKAQAKPGPIFRGMIGGAAKAKEQIEQRAGTADQEPGTTPRRRAFQEQADEEQILEWFTTCDHNANGWVSFREAKISLKFARPRFQAFDEDRDGRLVLEEFTASYEFSFRYGSGFKPPLPKPGPKKPKQRAPDQIRNAYDTDLDGQLGSMEITRMLADYERSDVTADVVLRLLDTDLDQKLAGTEIEGLVVILHPVALPLVETTLDPTADTKPATLDDLFGTVVLRADSGTTPNPPLIVGPVPHFRRLDIDNDGKISVRDLEELLRPHQTGVRVQTVVNTLDLDGDGALSQAEFFAALVHISSPEGAK